MTLEFFFDPINARKEKTWVGWGQAGAEILFDVKLLCHSSTSCAFCGFLAN